jgi:flagellar basal-body rod protein FlgB
VFNLDAHIGVHADALRVRSQRAEVIARNLANADTPQFKARDLAFREALRAAGDPGTVSLATTRAGHMGGPGAADGGVEGAALKYRTPLAPSLDGNTVDVQVEQASFAENAVRYQATLTFINSRLKGLMTAITGQ